MPTTRQWEIQCFSATTLSFPDFLSAQNMVRIIGGKIVYWKWSESIWEKPKITPRVAGDLAAIFRRERSDDRKCVCCSQATGDSGYRGFELPRVKITVNVWRKSRGNRFWFELAGLDCTVNMTNINFRSFHYFFVEGLERKKTMKTPPSLHFWAFPVSTFIEHFQSVVFQLSLDHIQCSSNSHNCHVNAICQGAVGSYICICKPGYMGNGRTCSPNGKKLTQSHVLQNPRC